MFRGAEGAQLRSSSGPKPMAHINLACARGLKRKAREGLSAGSSELEVLSLELRA